MIDGEIIVIESTKELLDDKGNVVGKVITDKAGAETKIKKGQGGKLESRWEWLDGEGIGKAIKLTVKEFKPPNSDKSYPFVADFTIVKDAFVAQAAEKVQSQTKVERNDSIESQTSQKGGIEVLKALIDMGKLNEAELGECAEYAMAAVRWGTARINLPSVIIQKIEGAKIITKQDSEAPKTAGELFNWMMECNPEIKAPRLWVQVEYGVTPNEELTEKKIEELYTKIKKDKKFNKEAR